MTPADDDAQRDDAQRDDAIAPGRLSTDPCVVCARPLTARNGLGICVRTWSVYCLTCATRVRYTTPRGTGDAI